MDALYPALYPALFVLLWSTGFIGARYGLPHADPLALLCCRYSLVLVLMTALAWMGRAPWPQGLRAWWRIGISGLLVHGLYLGGVFTAIALGLPAGPTALIVGLQPVLTATLAGRLLGESVSRRQWLGLLLGLGGVAAVLAARQQGLATATAQPGSAAMAADPWALTAAGLALLGITLGTLYQKRYCPPFDWRTGAVAQFLPALLVTAPLAAMTGQVHVNPVPAFWFALGWLTLVLSLGAVRLLNHLIRAHSAVNVASLFYLTPACTALMAWALFDERLGALGLAGMAAAMTGVWLARKTAA